jgi:poly-beta-hydroxyalkanoate depolymerase
MTVMSKRRIDTPGLLDFQKGIVAVKRIELVFNEPNFKVWEVSLKSRNVEITPSIVWSDHYYIELSAYDHSMYLDTRHSGHSTKLYLDLNPKKHWNVSTTSSKSDFSIIAYAIK